jgi:hypothetical protein
MQGPEEDVSDGCRALWVLRLPAGSPVTCALPHHPTPGKSERTVRLSAAEGNGEEEAMEDFPKQPLQHKLVELQQFERSSFGRQVNLPAKQHFDVHLAITNVLVFLANNVRVYIKKF